jgi:hypothetical protein
MIKSFISTAEGMTAGSATTSISSTPANGRTGAKREPHVEKITENILRRLASGAIGNAGAER